MTRNDILTLAQRLREYNHNPHHINPVSDAFHGLITDSADALAQLAAIQGGMGEADKHEAQPEVAENTGSHAMATNQLPRQEQAVARDVEGVAAPCEASPGDDIFAWATFDGEGSYDLRLFDGNESYRDDFRRNNPKHHPDWVFPLYRNSITAAMAAEVERLKQQIENYRSQFGELHIARNLLSRLSRAGFEIGDDLAASIIALRAELAEVKGREAVQVGWALTLPDGRVTLEKAYPHWIDGDMGGDGYSAAPLYTTPHPAPAQDVAGLVEALRVAAPYVEAKFASEQDRYAEEYARLPETAQVRADIAKVRASLAAHDKQSGEDA